MKNELHIWGEELHLAPKYDLDEIVENAEGLTLRFADARTGQPLTLFYDCEVCAYTSTDESYWIGGLEALLKQYGAEFVTRHTFFEVRDSDYVRQVEQGCCGLVPASHLHHLKILAANAIMDIVAFAPPTVQPSAPPAPGLA